MIGIISSNCAPELYACIELDKTGFHELVSPELAIFSKTGLDVLPNNIANTKTTNKITNNKKGVSFIPFIYNDLIYSIHRKY